MQLRSRHLTPSPQSESKGRILSSNDSLKSSQATAVVAHQNDINPKEPSQTRRSRRKSSTDTARSSGNSSNTEKCFKGKPHQDSTNSKDQQADTVHRRSSRIQSQSKPIKGNKRSTTFNDTEQSIRSPRKSSKQFQQSDDKKLPSSKRRYAVLKAYDKNLDERIKLAQKKANVLIKAARRSSAGSSTSKQDKRKSDSSYAVPKSQQKKINKHVKMITETINESGDGSSFADIIEYTKAMFESANKSSLLVLHALQHALSKKRVLLYENMFVRDECYQEYVEDERRRAKNSRKTMPYEKIPLSRLRSGRKRRK